MDDIGMGRMIIDTDGTHTLNQDDNISGQKTFLEVDGQLYRMSRDIYDRLDIDCTTAKVISKTDKTIRLIKFERGGWRLNMNNYGGFDFEV